MGQRKVGPFALLTLFLAGCGGQPPTGPSSSSATRIIGLDLGVTGSSNASTTPGGTLQFWALAKHQDGSKTDATNLVQWQTSNTSVATIAAGGLLSGLSPGTVMVSATYEQSATLQATVKELGCDDATITPSSITYNSLKYPPYSYWEPSFTLTAAKGCAVTFSTDAGWLGRLYGGPLPYTTTMEHAQQEFSYALNANTAPAVRIGRIHAAIGGRDLIFTVTQEAPHCAYELSPPETNLPLAGGSGGFDVIPSPSTCAWEIDRDWQTTSNAPIRITSSRSGIGRAHVTFVADAVRSLTNEAIPIRDYTGVSGTALHTVHVGGW